MMLPFTVFVTLAHNLLLWCNMKRKIATIVMLIFAIYFVIACGLSCTHYVKRPEAHWTTVGVEKVYFLEWAWYETTVDGLIKGVAVKRELICMSHTQLPSSATTTLRCE